MITGFKHKGLRELFETGKSGRVAADLRKKLTRQLDLLNAATSPQDMNLPGFVLHELKPAYSGVWSVRVSGNWRLTFRFAGGDAYDVDLVDYH